MRRAIIYLLDRGSSSYVLRRLENNNYIVIIPYSFFYDHFYGSFKNYIYAYRLFKRIFDEKKVYKFDFGIFSSKNLEIFKKFIKIKRIREIIINENYLNNEFFENILKIVSKINIKILKENFYEEKEKYYVDGFLVRRNIEKDLEEEIKDYLEIVSKVKIRNKIYYIKPLKIERIFYYPNEYFIIRKGKIIEKCIKN